MDERRDAAVRVFRHLKDVVERRCQYLRPVARRRGELIQAQIDSAIVAASRAEPNWPGIADQMIYIIAAMSEDGFLGPDGKGRAEV